jgi:hypothetical protein
MGWLTFYLLVCFNMDFGMVVGHGGRMVKRKELQICLDWIESCRGF